MSDDGKASSPAEAPPESQPNIFPFLNRSQEPGEPEVSSGVLLPPIPGKEKSVRRDKSVRQENESPSKELLLYFAEEYEKRFKVPYNINWGKEMKLFSSLLERYGPEKIKKAVKWYLRIRDDFFLTSGYSVGVFYQKFNAILLMGRNSFSEVADRLVEEQLRKKGSCSQNPA